MNIKIEETDETHHNLSMLGSIQLTDIELSNIYQASEVYEVRSLFVP